MSRTEHWKFPRPLRKLTHVPERLTLFLGLAEGLVWEGDIALHLAFEDAMSKTGMKSDRGYRERLSKQGHPGSTGRTNAAALSALGLISTYPDSRTGEYVIRTTLAGEALARRKPPHQILQRQVLAYQFPSGYSEKTPNTRIAKRFRVRPAILLLRTLQDSRLDGYITQEEVALLMMTYGDRHDAKTANIIASKIIDFRDRGKESLPGDYLEKFKTRKKQKDENFYNGLDSYANTFFKWMEYTGFVTSGPVENSLQITEGCEVEKIIEEWGEPIKLNPEKIGYSNYQFRYGLTYDKEKDTRNLAKMTSPTPAMREKNLVLGIYRRIIRTRIVTELTYDLVREVSDQVALPEERVEQLLTEIIPPNQKALDEFLNEYYSMAFMGTEDAIEFEAATAEIFSTRFNLGSLHTGQKPLKEKYSNKDRGGWPDVEVWSNKEGNEWLGIVDTKASPRYNLPNDHINRMEGYLEDYEYHPIRPASFFLYIAGGLIPNFNKRISYLIQENKIHGSAIPIDLWIKLIKDFDENIHDSSSLNDLFSLDRTITVKDVEEFLSI